tara:strand:- start:2422 stop:2922 length:501 start_codon:yes stop_codon:yes gene_type:complete
MVDHHRSSLTLSVQAGGQLIEGRFGEWRAVIVFDEAKPEASVVDVQIDMPSLVLSVNQAETIAKGKDWLGVHAFPMARFHGAEFTVKTDGTYDVAGRLELKGSSQPVYLHVDLQIDEDESHALVHTSILRDAFGVGQGDAARFVPDEIPISAEIWAVRSIPNGRAE